MIIYINEDSIEAFKISIWRENLIIAQRGIIHASFTCKGKVNAP